MSDTLNALQMLNQPRTTGQLPAPVVVNPLAALSAGVGVARESQQYVPGVFNNYQTLQKQQQQQPQQSEATAPAAAAQQQSTSQP